jgi:NAD(P)-dependent dehydrogenase (short-subunit alcohol dehydrogenase family)
VDALGKARFDGTAVVVTGVGHAGQLGETVARAFGELGATVHCLNRSQAVQDRVAELRARGIAAIAHEIDLTNFAATAERASAIASAHGGKVAAVLALAGGFAMSGPVAESTPDVFRDQIAMNLATAYATARAFMPYVRAGSGAFVFAAAAAVLGGGRVGGMSAYAMAKGGVVQLVRALAQEERDSGVRVNALAPTALRTQANLGSMSDRTRYVEREEFAAAAVALCGPAFARVSGQIIELA